jgi:hypothetical protein
LKTIEELRDWPTASPETAQPVFTDKIVLIEFGDGPHRLLRQIDRRVDEPHL